ncbi:MAG: VWA domain-containing protein [Reichenbachiella sp.]
MVTLITTSCDNNRTTAALEEELAEILLSSSAALLALNSTHPSSSITIPTNQSNAGESSTTPLGSSETMSSSTISNEHTSSTSIEYTEEELKDIRDQESDKSYSMILHNLSTDIPSLISLQFQVTNSSRNGVPYLNNNDFTIHENGTELNHLVTGLQIKKQGSFNYSLYTALLIDNSRSMTQEDLDIVKTAAITFIQNKMPQQYIALYSFSETAQQLVDYTTNIAELTTGIQSIEVEYAPSALHEALITSATTLTSYTQYGPTVTQGVIVAVTNEADTKANFSIDNTIEILDNTDVFIVGVGDLENESSLQQLGSGGTYFNTLDNIDSTFTEVSHAILNYANSFYTLEYLSPTRSDNDQTVTISISENENNDTDATITTSFNSSEFYSITEGIMVTLPSDTALIDTIVFDLSAGDTSKTITLTSYFTDVLPEFSGSAPSGLTITSPSANTLLITVTTVIPDTIPMTIIDNANSDTTVIIVIIHNVQRPQAQNVSIDYSPDSLSLMYSYAFYDPAKNSEDGTIIMWYRNGIELDPQPDSLYSLALSDKGQTFSISVTPVSNAAESNEGATIVDSLTNVLSPFSHLTIDGLTDSRDGATYDIVALGNQVWMAENLAYLPSIEAEGDSDRDEPMYYIYDFEPSGTAGEALTNAKETDTFKQHGVLYNWPAAMAEASATNDEPSGIQGICPTGWHVPSQAEWKTLADYVDQFYNGQVSGSLLQDTAQWTDANNIEQYNALDFSALPSGKLDDTATFRSYTVAGYWWTTRTPGGFRGQNNAYAVTLRYDEPTIEERDYDRQSALSIRCIQD